MANVNEFALPTKQDVFLCHNSADKGVVGRLQKLLAANQISSWYDAQDLTAGDRWHERLSEGLDHSRAIAICLGPEGLGKWQKEEVEIAKAKQVNDGKKLIPLTLPTCSDDLTLPAWLDSTHAIDLRHEGLEADPFGQLLKAIDGRPPAGRYRPTVVVLANRQEPEEPTVKEALSEITTACRSVLHRVRVVEYTETTLKAVLEERLQQADLFVSLLSRNSFSPFGDTFANGIAVGARQLALRLKVPTLEWRSENLLLPEDAELALPFRNTDIKKWLPQQLGREVAQQAFDHFQEPHHGDDSDVNRKKSILGFPTKGADFARQIQSYLARNQIRCDSAGKWERVLKKLTSGANRYDALIVILNGDSEWYDECSEWLDDLEETKRHAIPQIGAYCHRVETSDQADPVPLGLDQFDEYFGNRDLQRLAQRILSAKGAE